MRRRPAQALVPGRSPSPVHLLAVSFVAAAAALPIAWLNGLSPLHTVVLAGLSAALAVGSAVALIARGSRRLLEAAYLELDQALFTSERECDRLSRENEELAGANVELRAAQIAFAELLNLANEQSNGQMRVLVEETGAGLAEILSEQLRFAQRIQE